MLMSMKCVEHYSNKELLHEMDLPQIIFFQPDFWKSGSFGSGIVSLAIHTEKSPEMRDPN